MTPPRPQGGTPGRAGAGPLRRWIPVAVYVLAILAASSVPNLRPPGSWPLRDKLIHLVEYGILGWLSARAVGSRSTGGWAITVGLSAVVATIDEFYQSFVPGRFASLADAVADIFGAAGGAAAWTWVPWRRKPRTDRDRTIGG